jgi:hypothetical protein
VAALVAALATTLVTALVAATLVTALVAAALVAATLVAALVVTVRITTSAKALMITDLKILSLAVLIRCDSTEVWQLMSNLVKDSVELGKVHLAVS